MAVVTVVSCWIETVGDKVSYDDSTNKCCWCVSFYFLQVFGVVIKLLGHGHKKHLKKTLSKAKTTQIGKTPCQGNFVIPKDAFPYNSQYSCMLPAHTY